MSDPIYIQGNNLKLNYIIESSGVQINVPIEMSYVAIKIINKGTSAVSDAIATWNANINNYHNYELWEIQIKLVSTLSTTSLNSLYVSFTLPHIGDKINSLCYDGNINEGLIAPNSGWKWGAVYAPLPPNLPSKMKFFAANSNNGKPIDSTWKTIWTYIAPSGSSAPKNIFLIGSPKIPPHPKLTEGTPIHEQNILGTLQAMENLSDKFYGQSV